MPVCERVRERVCERVSERVASILALSPLTVLAAMLPRAFREIISLVSIVNDGTGADLRLPEGFNNPMVDVRSVTRRVTSSGVNSMFDEEVRSLLSKMFSSCFSWFEVSLQR